MKETLNAVIGSTRFVVGLGPAVRYLDMQSTCELRRDGIAVRLRRWVDEDLNRSPSWKNNPQRRRL
jgi:hypothetical protein